MKLNRSAIPFANEENPGVYIRRNGDDDNANGTPDRNDANVAGENDLIEVTLATALAAPVGIRFELEKSSADIRIWSSSTKGTELLGSQNASTITFPGGVPSSVWVEWVTPGNGPAQATLDFRLEDAVSNNVVFTDRLVFHPFTSIVIVLGGEGQQPSDPIPPPDASGNSFGTFQTAIDLYREGYDVHMYNEDDVMEDPTAATGVVFDEVRSAIAFRGVTSVGIFGYSHGGGATYNLASQLTTNPPPAGTFTISFTAYIDAVTQNNIGAENRLPPGTGWHLNLYQQGALSGGPVPGSNEQYDVDNHALWMLNVSHSTIDDHVQVRDWVKMRLRQNVSR